MVSQQGCIPEINTVRKSTGKKLDLEQKILRVSQGGPCSLVPFQNCPRFPCSHILSECFRTVIFRNVVPCSQKLANVPLFPSIFCQCSLVPKTPGRPSIFCMLPFILHWMSFPFSKLVINICGWCYCSDIITVDCQTKTTQILLHTHLNYTEYAYKISSLIATVRFLTYIFVLYNRWLHLLGQFNRTCPRVQSGPD